MSIQKHAISIVLINPPSLCVDDDRVEPPLGLLYIAAALLSKGYENTSLFDMTGCKTESEIAMKVRNSPDSHGYGIRCFCTNYQYVRRIISKIQSTNPDALTVLGGPNPTGIPQFTLEDSNTDIVITGEGEDSFVECIDRYCLSFIKSKGIIEGKTRLDLDAYPFPARHLLSIDSYSRRLMGYPVISLISSRGCKYKCIHCNSVVMGGGSKVRYRSTRNIMDEIESLRDKYQYFRFNDDHFTGNGNLHQLLTQIKSLNIIFRAFARIEDLAEKTCKLLKEAGCVHLTIGLESMNRDNLKVLGKTTQLDSIRNIAIAKSCGLILRASFMVGLPYDTESTVMQYFQTASRLAIDEFAVYPLIPYPGSKIWSSPEKYGYEITDKDFTRYVQMGQTRRSCYALKHKNFTSREVEKWKDTAESILEASGIKHMQVSTVAT
ncbi:MAG: B12-binding domain-containing radical SAM protein [Nitrospirae bacterium]|nr:B12-binding domain-containing radical SAM protein [Nitrospirota bacterium]